MTLLASGDVRAFYEALGIELPGWSQREAPVRCFASPDSHKHGDRPPSTSVNLENGAWCCHGCGAAGGPYHAALAVGHSPRSAIELMITHGLIDRDPPTVSANGRTNPAAARRSQVRAPAPPARLAADEADVSRWGQALARRPALLAQLGRDRAWRYEAMSPLEIGLDPSGRLTIPIRDGDHQLRGVLRYEPWHTHGPKMLAVRGTRLGLIPHPQHERSLDVVLVEGPADMLAARSRGLPAIAVPGVHAWRAAWAELLTGRHVTVIMDCDTPGRDAARRIADDLAARSSVRVVDLQPGRDDGYDLTDALLDRTALNASWVTTNAPARRACTPADAERGLER